VTPAFRDRRAGGIDGGCARPGQLTGVYFYSNMQLIFLLQK
jgi:hypothetical protein